MLSGYNTWKAPRQSARDPDAGLDQHITGHNLDRAPLQRLSHPCQSAHDYYRPGNPAGSVRIIYTLEDGRFLVAAPDVHGVERFYVAAVKSHLVLAEDVTRQFIEECRHKITGAEPAEMARALSETGDVGNTD